MVGKPMPRKTASTPGPTPKGTEAFAVASPSIAQGAASAAADAALQGKGRESSSGKSGTASLRNKGPGRLVSLDAFRGFIMTMLAASGFGIARFAEIDDSSEVWQVHSHEFWNKLAFHFDHPAWRSAFDSCKVSFWDLIQPAFMFMVGVAMPFSYTRRSRQNHSILRRALHAMVRALVLVLIGVFLQSGGRQHTTWEFPNVLCQIGLGYFFAWFLLNFRPIVQGVALAAILTGYWGLFYFNPPPADYDYASVSAHADQGEVFEGRFAAWSKNANAAFFFDRWLLPKLRTVPEPDSPPADDAAALYRNADLRFVLAARQSVSTPGLAFERMNSDWLPVMVTLDEETKNPEVTANNEAQPPTADTPVTADSSENAAIPESPAADTPAADTPDTDTPDTDTPAADTPDTDTPAAESATEPALPLPPAGTSWIRRAFLRNDVPWTPNRGGYATLNFVPSVGTTLLGMLCGQLLLAGSLSHWKKLGMLIVGAGICLGLGILADMTVCPIVKRIWTPSWVLFSGGYVIGMLALFYLFFDIAPFKFLAFPLVVVGTNSLLIYLLGSTLGGWARNSVINVHFSGLIETVFGPKALDPNWYAPITLTTGTYVVFWLFLYWLHRQKIYLRL